MFPSENFLCAELLILLPAPKDIFDNRNIVLFQNEGEAWSRRKSTSIR